MSRVRKSYNGTPRRNRSKLDTIARKSARAAKYGMVAR